MDTWTITYPFWVLLQRVQNTGVALVILGSNWLTSRCSNDWDWGSDGLFWFTSIGMILGKVGQFFVQRIEWSFRQLGRETWMCVACWAQWVHKEKNVVNCILFSKTFLRTCVCRRRGGRKSGGLSIFAYNWRFRFHFQFEDEFVGARHVVFRCCERLRDSWRGRWNKLVKEEVIEAISQKENKAQVCCALREPLWQRSVMNEKLLGVVVAHLLTRQQ
jgi:hypothetical protein